MGRPKKPDVKTVSFRINGSTVRQLLIEAKAKGWPLGTYLRQLLQTYAPGVDQERVAKLGEAAERLDETK